MDWTAAAIYQTNGERTVKLYIANCTQQNHIVQTRVPEKGGPLIMEIPQGSQIMYGGADLNPLQVEAIIKQLQMYGLAVAEDVITSKMSGKVLLIARRDAPVTRDLILKVYQHNHGILQKEGIETRQRAAIAMNNSMTQRAELAGIQGQDMMEMSIQEEKAGSIPQDAQVSEGVRVTSEQSFHDNPPARRGSNRQRRAA
jgi:hypothetical protein